MGSFASISRPADFRGVLRDGARAGERGLAVYVRRSTGTVPRLGMVVRAPNAVIRNRVKRRLRAAFREVRPTGGTDVVIRADGRAAGKDFQEMVSIIRDALSGSRA